MASTTTSALLRQVDLFAGLSDRELAKVAQRAKQVHHGAGTEIAVQGEDGVALHVIESGSAEVEVGGRVVRTLGPGDYFGDLSLIDGRPRSATVRTTSDTTTHAIVSWSFRPLLDEPAISKALLLAMCARLRSAEAR